jgi:CPA2 family monovalent cation:H+ antiporter-2
LRHTDAQVKEFKTYLHQHEFEAPKNIEKTEITLQQLELNKEELKVSANHILEKKRMVWSWVSNETGKGY